MNTSASPNPGHLPPAEAGSNCLSRFVLGSARRIALPIAVYPGAALTGASVQDVVTNSRAQFEAQAALYERFQTPVALSAMDLSAEAEAFGCEIHLADNEVPTVVGSLVATPEDAAKLKVPTPGDKRTRVYLETIGLLRKLPGQPLVLAGCIGPFSLAARLVGMNEALGLTITDPALLHVVLAKCTAFLTSYARAFQAAGADGVIMAEPAAGLLSPRALATFSSAYVKQVVTATADGHFALVLHNCAAKLVHVPAVLEGGARVFHFGAPMDLPAALAKVNQEIVLCGNLDPARVFCQSSAEDVTAHTRNLLATTQPFRNYVLSSGCDVPAAAPLANLAAFFAAARGA